MAALLAASLGIACHTTSALEEAVAPATVIYAAPDGRPDGDGSTERPLDLATALSATSAIPPGATLWLRGGTYNVADLTSTLSGTAGAPITVQSVPGEHAILDGATAINTVLTVQGAWTVFRDFEVTSSDLSRKGSQRTRAAGVDVHGANVKLVNLVVHDLANGVGLWSDAVDTEVYGNIIYYNGWIGPDRPHGHGIYTQNKTGVRRVTDNIVFAQFGMGIHAYASEQGYLDDMHFEGNVVANNGIPNGDFNILVGGHRLAQRPVLRSNFTYDNPGAGNHVGFAAGCVDVELRDNYFAMVSGGYAVQLVDCSGVVEGNVIVGGTRGVTAGRIVPHSELAALHPANEFVPERPSATRTFVRPNRYDQGRAHVIVYNWERLPAVQVDLTAAAVPVGGAYQIRDVRNLSGAPLVSGRYAGGTVTLPLEGLIAAPIVGWQPTPPHTAPEFGVFLVTSRPAPRSRIGTMVSRMMAAFGL